MHRVTLTVKDEIDGFFRETTRGSELECLEDIGESVGVCVSQESRPLVILGRAIIALVEQDMLVHGGVDDKKVEDDLINAAVEYVKFWEKYDKETESALAENPDFG